MKRKKYVPVTPGGTRCTWLESTSEEEAIQKLMKEAAHMPYDGWEDFEDRGYTIEEVEGS